MNLLKEFCVENMTLVPAAVRGGAHRIELCDNLAVGGTSPSYGVVRAAVSFAAEHGVALMVMCRPRGGDFVYDARERQMLLDDVRCARGLGATGVVFGCLRHDARRCLELDTELVRALVDAAKGQPQGIAQGKGPVQVTFHMAFDELDEQHQLAAIDELAALGVDRVLTHGGAAGTPIANNYDRLRRLISYVSERVTILPGGGITWENADEVAHALGVTEVHGTKIVHL